MRIFFPEKDRNLIYRQSKFAMILNLNHVWLTTPIKLPVTLLLHNICLIIHLLLEHLALEFLNFVQE